MWPSAMQPGIQLPPCQWPIQPSGCTSLRVSLQPTSSLYSITSSTSDALSSIKWCSYPHHCERSFSTFVISCTRHVSRGSDGYHHSDAESNPSMRQIFDVSFCEWNVSLLSVSCILDAWNWVSHYPFTFHIFPQHGTKQLLEFVLSDALWALFCQITAQNCLWRLFTLQICDYSWKYWEKCVSCCSHLHPQLLENELKSVEDLTLRAPTGLL